MQQRRAELQRQVAANLLPDPLTAVATATSAYSTEQGFRELSAQELSVALTAGGLIDLLLDVRTHAEFTAGGLGGSDRGLTGLCGWVAALNRQQPAGVLGMSAGTP